MDYVSNTETQLQEMLEAIGVPSFEALLMEIPRSVRATALQLAPGM